MGADRPNTSYVSQAMNYLKRCRFLPLQLLLVVLVILCYLVMNAIVFKKQDKSVWESRAEHLSQYSDKEFDLSYLRKVSVTDSQIEKLKDDKIDEMNETELIVNVHSFLDNADITCSRRLRMGYVGEGGWEVCDDANVRPKKGNCLIYSFGVADKLWFEEDVARVYGCSVHSFNAYLDREDYNTSDYNIQVHSYSLGRFSEIAPDGKELYAFDDIKTLLGHSQRPVDIIKIDTEGSEWPALNGMIEEGDLKNIKQVLVEFHVGMPSNEGRLRRQLRVLRAMSRLGFRKFYVYKNARGGFHHPGFPVMRARQYDVHYLNTRYLDK